MKTVSLVLCTYNSVDTLQATLDSIKNQDYGSMEVVIKDGGSSDGTLELINKFIDEFQGKGKKVRWKSEVDNGIYDAMNQGYLMSSGEVIVFFNDVFWHKNSISIMMQKIEENWDICIGGHADLVYMAGDKIVRYWKMGQGKMRQGWMPGHPTLFLKRDIYEKNGLYNMNYRCSGDYEFMVRTIMGNEDRLIYVPVLLVKMYYGGTSTSGLKAYVISLRESHKALKDNGIKKACIIDLKRTIKLITQFWSAYRSKSINE